MGQTQKPNDTFSNRDESHAGIVRGYILGHSRGPNYSRFLGLYVDKRRL